ncbi:hypothetical protein FF1_030208 [Malus domestica]
MATITASSFASTSSHVSYGAVSSGSDPKTGFKKMSFGKQTLTHNGLRALNSVDELRVRIMANSAARQTRVFLGTEVGPWSKTGGLGDVLGGLPPAMAANGHRAMTISPRYDQYKDAWDTEVTVQLKVGDKTETVRFFFHCYKRGVDRVFVDHPLFLERVWAKTASKIYGPVTGVDFKDNQLRFSLLCQAALVAPRVLNLNSSKYFSGLYGEEVVFIANDWHTALFPCYLKAIYKPKGIYRTAKVAFCIHNIAYQGRFAFADFALLNLPNEFKSSFDFIDGYDKPVKGRKINWMKAGILESDKVLTVSPYNDKELQ